MNAFWASENCDTFIVFRSFPSQENAPENSNQNWPSLKGSDQAALSLLTAHLRDSVEMHNGREESQRSGRSRALLHKQRE
ncbi:hypothetical protein BMJ34_15070 [Sinorhizobium medicae]|nr:hypothetical protein BMJ34_15070 [Sinorhizobium medicae]